MGKGRVGSDWPVGIHPVFHVGCLKPFLGYGDNTITIKDLVTLKDSSYKSHVPKQILDCRSLYFTNAMY